MLSSLIVVGGCNYRIDKTSGNVDPLSPAEKAQLSFQKVFDRVIGPKCVSCHNESTKELNLSTYEAVTAPGILSRIDDSVFVGKRMPKGGSLSSEELQILRAWIDMGAPKDAPGSQTPGPSPSPTPGSGGGSIPQDVGFDFVKQEVLNPRCISCHGPEATIPLDTYAQVKSRMPGIISSVLVNKTMPKNATLTKREYDILLNWIGKGFPEKPENPGEPKPTPVPSPTPAPVPLEPKFESIKANILSKKCVSCHSPGGEAKNIPLITREDLVDSPREIVMPGNPDESGIVISIERIDDKRMPPPQVGGALSAAEIQAVRLWIQNGAKD